MISLHDKLILSYYVNLDKDKIVFQLKDRNLDNNIECIFHDVIAHHFENQIKNSIIFELDEDSIESFLKYNYKLLMKQKGSCWPYDYDDINDLKQKLIENSYKYYTITPSYGMGGWVVSKGVQICKYLI